MGDGKLRRRAAGRPVTDVPEDNNLPPIWRRNTHHLWKSVLVVQQHLRFRKEIDTSIVESFQGN